MRDRFTTVFRKACRPPSVIINRYSLNLTMRVYVIIRTFIVKNLIKKKENLEDLDCQKISAGLLEKGLRTSVVSLVESTRDILSRF